MRIVFDSSVYLAAIKPNSYSYELIRKARPGGAYQVYASPEILIEVKEKLLSKFDFSIEQAAGFLNFIQRYAILINPSRQITGVLADLDDHIILECALEAKANIIITPDRQLLKLKKYQDIVIAHPSMLKYWFSSKPF